MKMVQLDMMNFPLIAITTCLDAGFGTKSMAVRGPRKNKATKGREPNTMDLTGEGQRRHNWQRSADKGITIERDWTTSGGETTDEGLISGLQYYYRCRLTFTKGKHGLRSAWFWETDP